MRTSDLDPELKKLIESVRAQTKADEARITAELRARAKQHDRILAESAVYGRDRVYWR